MNDIRDQITRLRVKNADDKRFVLEGSLASCLPREKVANILREDSNIEPYLITEMTDIIDRGARKVFAILILIQKITDITRFVEHHLHSNRTLDEQLPFTKFELRTIFSRDQLRSELFEEFQWEFVAPVFRQRLSHQIFPKEIRLPFMENQKLGEGGFGQVFRVVIPSGHHDFEEIDPAKEALIVRKQLEGNDAWNNTGSNEHKIMCQLHHLKHPNILPLLGSYIYNDVPNFLLPLATGGDLDQFLKEEFMPTEFSEKESIYLALAGLASALNKLQNFKFKAFNTEMIGYHHDLKPKNVLVSDSRFILSDFGLSRLKTGDDSKTPFRIGQGHYLAPECEDPQNDFEKGVVSRATDVWSLGCISLEVIVFMVRGADSLAGFRKKRAFKNGRWTTRTFFRGDSVNEAVLEELGALMVDKSDTVRMVAYLISQILVMDPKKRVKANEIAIRLRLIYLLASIQSIHHVLKGVMSAVGDHSIDEEFEKFQKLAQKLASGKGKLAQESLDPESLERWANPKFLPGIVESLKDIQSSKPEHGKIRDGLINGLQAANQFLTLAFALGEGGDASIGQGQRNLPIVAQRPKAHSRELPPTKNLRAEDFVVKKPGRFLSISDDERWLAVEKDWEIVVYALPSGDKEQVITLPAQLSPYLHFWSAMREWPRFRFSHDGQHLVVSWVLEVYSYPVGRALRTPLMIFSQFTDGGLDRDCPIDPQISGAYSNPILLGDISSDSSKIALFWVLYIGWTVRTRLKVVGGVDGNINARKTIYSDDIDVRERVSGFSPDGKLLALSTILPIQDTEGTRVTLLLIDISEENPDQPAKFFKLPWNEKFSPGLLPRLRNYLANSASWKVLLYFYPRAQIGVSSGRWIVAYWEKSNRKLNSFDIIAEQWWKRTVFSCFDHIQSNLEETKVSGDFTTLACRFKQTKWRLPKLRKDQDKASKNMVAFADTQADRIFCLLEDFSFDDFCISRSGTYAATVGDRRSQIKIFRVRDE